MEVGIMRLIRYRLFALRKKNSGTSIYCVLAIVITSLLLLFPATAVTDDERIAGEDQRQPGTSSGPAENGTSKLKLPRSAYELNESISGLLGVELPSWAPRLLDFQFTGIYQNMPAFHNPYQGANSLKFDHSLGRQFTHSYGIYFGSQVTRWLQAYLDVEMFRGSGISKGLGLGGYVNGDVIRAGSSNLGNGPYIARFYLRSVIPLSGERAEPSEPALDQLPSSDPTSRIEIKLGRFAPTDDIDSNRYANNQRTQFLNYAFLYNTAWDYGSDTRGYSNGIVVSLVQPSWRLTYGAYQEPTTANGIRLDWDINKARSDNLELTLKSNKLGTVLRLLAYYNQGRMGRYREALAIATATSTTPDVIGDEKPGRTKYGFGINLEQPFADDGETGFFARGGWSDGHTSAFSYTEVDRHISAGAQVSGVHWKRRKDRFGIAFAVHGLSTMHKRYLEAGGLGMLLGDGKLNYGLEQIFEVYYMLQLGRYLQISPDFQYIRNPGYNRDRGPVQVYSLRFHMSY